MNYKKPKRLKVGDTVAVLSPSWSGPNVFPHVYESGVKILQKWGLKIKEYPLTHAKWYPSLENAKMRAEDVNDAFADAEVKAIFSSIWGEDSIRILPFLDTEVIMSNPKIIMGFSDTVTILTYLNTLWLVTFNGPAIMAGFAQMKNLPKEFEKHVHDMLFDVSDIYNYPSYGVYSDCYLDWSKQDTFDKVKSLQLDGWMNVIQGSWIINWELFWGCIEVLDFMRWTDFFPDANFWENKILFFETSEEEPPIHIVRRMLRYYWVQWIFDKVHAILFARARGYSDEKKQELEVMLKEVVAIEFWNSSLPIITNAEFGHSDPQIVLPNWVKAEIDLGKLQIKLLESPII